MQKLLAAVCMAAFAPLAAAQVACPDKNVLTGRRSRRAASPTCRRVTSRSC
jgi:hypothetical protein